MSDQEFLIAGLGNPGPQYERTRHNAGFLTVDWFARQHGLGLTNEKWQGAFCRTRFADKRLLLVKPQTFMNKSGECVGRFADFYKIDPTNILIVHDDLDLPPGRVKAVARGGAGGHNGIRSIIRHLGTSEFSRLKLGIGRPERNEQGQGIPVERYVLASFTRTEQEGLGEQAAIACEAMEFWLEFGIDACMNRINGRCT